MAKSSLISSKFEADATKCYRCRDLSSNKLCSKAIQLESAAFCSNCITERMSAL
jgi:hypothetical protein